jgi:hypothetical protein
LMDTMIWLHSKSYFVRRSNSKTLNQIKFRSDRDDVAGIVVYLKSYVLGFDIKFRSDSAPLTLTLNFSVTPCLFSST